MTLRRLVILLLTLAGALVGSMLITDAEDSWLKFAAWVCFFVALNTPVLFAAPGSAQSCAAWLARRRNES